MSVWREMHKRSNGEVVRKEDIHKCTAVVEKCGGAQRIGGFYTLYKEHIKLNEEQKQSLRWHYYYIHLKDERFNRWRKYKVGVITALGDSGETTVKETIKRIEKKYGYFDGYTCEEVNTEMYKYVTKKNLEMLRNIRVDLNLHNLKMVGWKEYTVYKKAISAVFIQNLYYNSDAENATYIDVELTRQKDERRLLTSGKYREKVIGDYSVTYERIWKNNNGEVLTKVLTDKEFFAVIGTDVVATWQSINDEYVRKHGDWIYFMGPDGHDKDYCLLKGDNYYDQWFVFQDEKGEYRDKLLQEYGDKILCE